MTKRQDLPNQGPLVGLKVAHASLSVAGPFAAQMMAELGADVIWIENPQIPDITRERSGRGLDVDLNRRNTRNIGLNIPTPEGSEILAKILAEVDIFIEASKPGQYERWGWTDERMWEINPQLVIAHVSGFGQFGDPDYVGRASYDPIAQAFGGLMAMNGPEEWSSFPVSVLTGDYYTAMMTGFACLAAYVNAQRTGRGESIDAAQYEIVARTLANYGMNEWNGGTPFKKKLVQNQGWAGYNAYMCGDGEEVFMLMLGGGAVRRGVPLMGLEYPSEDYPENVPMVVETTPAGERLNAAITEFCQKHTASEVEQIMNENGIACSRVMKPKDMPDHPHYKARETFIEYRSEFGQDLKAITVVPRLKNAPGGVWRSGPRRGQDTRDILEDLGFSADQITALEQTGVVKVDAG